MESSDCMDDIPADHHEESSLSSSSFEEHPTTIGWTSIVLFLAFFLVLGGLIVGVILCCSCCSCRNTVSSTPGGVASGDPGPPVSGISPLLDDEIAFERVFEHRGTYEAEIGLNALSNLLKQDRAKWPRAVRDCDINGFVLDKFLDQGYGGVVFEAKKAKESVAVKFFIFRPPGDPSGVIEIGGKPNTSPPNAEKMAEAKQKYFEDVAKERKVLERFGSFPEDKQTPHLVHLVPNMPDVCCGGVPCVVTEFASGGTLSDLMKEHGRLFLDNRCNLLSASMLQSWLCRGNSLFSGVAGGKYRLGLWKQEVVLNIRVSSKNYVQNENH